APRSFLNLLDAVAMKIVGALAINQEIAIAADDRQEIIEVVRDAAREPADGFHFVGLAQPLLEKFLIVVSFLETGAHAIECGRHFRDFVAAAKLEWIVEIPLFESTDASDETRE